MTEIVGQEKPSLQDLAHFGVKGMRWGERMAARRTQRRSLRALDKKNKKEDNVARNAEIDAARTRYRTSARKNYKSAKAQYKTDKTTIGKYAARKKFNAVKQKNMDDHEIASQVKSGAETVGHIIGTVGLITVAALLNSSSANRRL